MKRIICGVCITFVLFMTGCYDPTLLFPPVDITDPVEPEDPGDDQTEEGDVLYTGYLPVRRVSAERTLTMQYEPTVYESGNPSGGTDYYFSDSSGNDSNDGLTPAAALKTFDAIQNGSIILGPGDRVLLKRGDRFSTTLWKKSVLYLPPENSGEDGNPVEITSYGDFSSPRPVIAPTASWHFYDEQYGLMIDGGHHFRIHDIDFEEGKAGIFLYTRTISWQNRSLKPVHHVEIYDCDFTDVAMRSSEHYHYEDNIGEWTPKINNNGYGLFWSAGIFMGTDFGTVSAGLYFHDINIHDVDFDNCDVGVGNAAYWYPYSDSIARDIVITDTTATGCLQGIFMLNNTQGIRIERAHLVSGGGYSASGICGAFMQYCQDVYLLDSKINYTARGTYLKNGELHHCHDGVGLDLEGGNRRVLIRDCEFRGNAGAGIMVCNTDPGQDVNGIRTANSDIFIIDTDLIDNCSNPDTLDYGLDRGSDYAFLSWQPDSTGYFSGLRFRTPEDEQGDPLGKGPISLDYSINFQLYGNIYEIIEE